MSDEATENNSGVDLQGDAGHERDANDPIASESLTSGFEESSSPVIKNKNLQWYVVNTYSGFEFKVKQALEEKIRQKGLEGLFGEIYIPQETVVELVKGQKKTSNRKYFPGYIIIQMELNEDSWHLVKDTPKVSGFVGDKTAPVPLSSEEVARLVTQMEEGVASPRSKMSFEAGQTVKVIEGPFKEFSGTIEEVNADKGKVKVLISIFGRPTPVELDFFMVEKAQV